MYLAPVSYTHLVGMLRGGVGDAVLDELAGERTGIGKRPAVQQRTEHDLSLIHI